MLRRGKVEVTGGFLLMMAWLNYSDTQGLLPVALVTCAAHELGHWCAIRLSGGEVCRIRLTAIGAEMRLAGPLTYGRELFCALAGPAVNLGLALVSAGIKTEQGMLFAGLNLALSCFNLVPVGRLDGGRALYCAVSMGAGQEIAEGVRNWLDRVLIALLLVAGGAAVWSGGGFTLFLAAVWLMAQGIFTGKNLP